jgi:hypothetical protein
VQPTITPLIKENTYVYFITLDGKQYRQYSANEYVEALEDAAQLDYIYNSPELNDGVQGSHNIKLLTFAEMMMSDVEMVI